MLCTGPVRGSSHEVIGELKAISDAFHGPYQCSTAGIRTFELPSDYDTKIVGQWGPPPNISLAASIPVPQFLVFVFSLRLCVAA